jgi:ribosomal protein L35
LPRFVDLGKLKYEQQKKAPEARKKQKTVEVKEVKMRPNIDTHDYEVKMRAMKRFFDDGDKVKVTLRFRGREMAHHAARHEAASEGASEDSHRDFQGRSRAEARRPPDDDGAGAKVARLTSPNAMKAESEMPKMKKACIHGGLSRRMRSRAPLQDDRHGQGQSQAAMGKRHGMIKRTNKFIRNARGTMVLSDQDAKIVKKYMPYDR